MKRYLGLLLALGFLVPFLDAQNSDTGYPKFTADFGTVVVAGAADELVYNGSSSWDKASELVWPVPLSPGVSAAVHAQWLSWLETNLRFQTVFPLATGKVTDDDWNIYDSDGDLCSRVHSDATAYLTGDWSVRAEAAVPFQGPGFSWKVLAGVECHQLSWESWDLTQTNTLASDGSTYTQSVSGMVGTYRQTWVLPYLGGGLSFRWEGAVWDFSLRASPFPLVSTTDDHLLRQLTINETLCGGFMVEPDLSFTVPMSTALGFKVDVSYQGTFFLRGDEVQSNVGAASGSSSAGFFSFSGAGGAGLQGLTVGASLVAGL